MKASEKEKVFKALGDKNRLEILEMLTKGELCAFQILQEMKIGQSTLSHHMKILCDSGIVNSRKDSRWVYYTVNAPLAKKFETLFGEYSQAQK